MWIRAAEPDKIGAKKQLNTHPNSMDRLSLCHWEYVGRPWMTCADKDMSPINGSNNYNRF